MMMPLYLLILETFKPGSAGLRSLTKGISGKRLTISTIKKALYSEEDPSPFIGRRNHS
jgi:hypothetical protein